MSQELLHAFVEALMRAAEIAAAVVIFGGVVVAMVRFVARCVRRDVAGFVAVRLDLGRFLSLGLELLLAADLLRTAMAPTLIEIAKLAAIAAIRTALNFFLAREIRRERAELQER